MVRKLGFFGLSLGLSALLATATLYLVDIFASDFAPAEAPLEARHGSIVLMGFATALGILSKTVFDVLTSERFEQEISGFSLSSALPHLIRSFGLAAIVTPLVLFSIYRLLAEINDVFLSALVCYQNGFFFQSVLRPGLGRAKTTKPATRNAR